MHLREELIVEELIVNDEGDRSLRLVDDVIVPESYTTSVPHRSCKCTMPCSSRLPFTTIRDVIFFSSMMARAEAANSLPEIVFGSRDMQSVAVRSSTSLPRFSSNRRRSPSLITPTNFSPSTTVVTPSFLRDIS